jgi:hypothetical protein
MRLSLYEQLDRDMLEAHTARLAEERRQRELAELRRELVGAQLDLAIIDLKRNLGIKYDSEPAARPRRTTGRRAVDSAARACSKRADSREYHRSRSAPQPRGASGSLSDVPRPLLSFAGALPTGATATRTTSIAA